MHRSKGPKGSEYADRATELTNESTFPSSRADLPPDYTMAFLMTLCLCTVKFCIGFINRYSMGLGPLYLAAVLKCERWICSSYSRYRLLICVRTQLRQSAVGLSSVCYRPTFSFLHHGRMLGAPLCSAFHTVNVHLSHTGIGSSASATRVGAQRSANTLMVIGPETLTTVTNSHVARSAPSAHIGLL